MPARCQVSSDHTPSWPHQSNKFRRGSSAGTKKARPESYRVPATASPGRHHAVTTIPSLLPGPATDDRSPMPWCFR